MLLSENSSTEKVRKDDWYSASKVCGSHLHLTPRGHCDCKIKRHLFELFLKFKKSFRSWTMPERSWSSIATLVTTGTPSSRLESRPLHQTSFLHPVWQERSSFPSNFLKPSIATFFCYIFLYVEWQMNVHQALSSEKRFEPQTRIEPAIFWWLVRRSNHWGTKT